MSEQEPAQEPPPQEVGATQGLIAAMERKVSKQWKKATGKMLAFSAGFSFKRDWKGAAEEVQESREVVARRSPSRAEPPPSRLPVVALFALAAMGMAVAVWAVASEPPPRDPALQGPLIESGRR